jgi:ribosome-associated protein
LRVEGQADSGWVLMDFGDVIVHVFSIEQRGFYRLEELWSAAVPLVRMQ